MRLKIKRRKGFARELKEGIKERAKKVFSLSPMEKDAIKRIKNASKKVVTKKKIVKLSKRVDFRNLF